MGVSLCRPSVQRRTVIDKRSRAPFVIRYQCVLQQSHNMFGMA
jgi:hypothetical protein